MLRKQVNRLIRRHKHAQWYLGYRALRNFTLEQRRGLETLAGRIPSFQCLGLHAVGNGGLIYDGTYRDAPGSAHLLKVALHPAKRADSLRRVMEATEKAGLPFLCNIAEIGVDPEDPRCWYQIQEKIEGMTVAEYLHLPVRRRLEVCDPLSICVDLLEQTRDLLRLRIIAPNVKAENVLIRPDRCLVRVDLDPYELIENGKIPAYPFRRLFLLLSQILEAFAPVWRTSSTQSAAGCDLGVLDTLLRRLAVSATWAYDQPHKPRAKAGNGQPSPDCFTDCDAPLALLNALRDSLDMSGAI